MKIGIDIDGVLTDLSGFILDYSIDYFKNLGKELINPKESKIEDMYDITDDEVSAFWTVYLMKYFTLPPRPRSSEFISKLQSEGNEIYIITSRGSASCESVIKLDETMKITSDWLEKNGIHPDKIIFNKNKMDVCRENGIEIMVDDLPHNIIEVSKEIKCLCFNTIYNEDLTGDNIIRCYSWADVYNRINEISKLS